MEQCSTVKSCRFNGVYSTAKRTTARDFREERNENKWLPRMSSRPRQGSTVTKGKVLTALHLLLFLLLLLRNHPLRGKMREGRSLRLRLSKFRVSHGNGNFLLSTRVHPKVFYRSNSRTRLIFVTNLSYRRLTGTTTSMKSLRPRSVQSKPNPHLNPPKRAFVPASTTASASTSDSGADPTKGGEGDSTNDSTSIPAAPKSNAQFRELMLSGGLKKKQS